MHNLSDHGGQVQGTFANVLIPKSASHLMSPNVISYCVLAVTLALLGCSCCGSSSVGVPPTPTSLPPTATPIPTDTATPIPTATATPTPPPPLPYVAVNFDRQIRVIDLNARKQKWAQVAVGDDQPVFINGPGTGTVYSVTLAGIGGSDGNAYAWDAVSGAQLMKFQDSDDNHGPSYSNGMLFFSANQAGTFGVHPGTSSWHVTPAGKANHTSIPVADANHVYVGEGDGNLYALKIADGSVAWRAAVGSSVRDASPILDGNHVIVGPVPCQGAYCLEAFDTQSGVQIWQKPVPGTGIGNRGLTSYNHALYGLTSTGQVFASDEASGTLLWQQDIHGATGYLVTDGYALYIETQSSNLGVSITALRLSDQKFIWTLQGDQTENYALLTAMNGVVYVGSDENTRYSSPTPGVGTPTPTPAPSIPTLFLAFKAIDGSLIWNTPV